MTDKIRLRAVEPEDVEFILDCENDHANWRWSDYRAPLSRNQLLTYALTYDADPLRAGQIRLIAEKDAQPVGIIDIFDINVSDSRAQIGICLHPDFRGKNWGVACMQSALDYSGNRLGIRKVTAKVSSSNPKAIALFKKSGFTEIAVLPDWHKIGASYHDFILFQKNQKEPD